MLSSRCSGARVGVTPASLRGRVSPSPRGGGQCRWCWASVGWGRGAATRWDWLTGDNNDNVSPGVCQHRGGGAHGLCVRLWPGAQSHLWAEGGTCLQGGVMSVSVPRHSGQRTYEARHWAGGCVSAWVVIVVFSVNPISCPDLWTNIIIPSK